MFALQFNQDLVQSLVEQRGAITTPIFQIASLMGEIEGYILVIALIYVAINKRLAVQSAVVVLLAMTVNHLLKIVIQNPRPFTLDQTHFEHWAVSNHNAIELAAEYSTPSGHAMAAGAFYAFLFLKIRNVYFRVFSVLAILITGVSRPVLGMHFVEDILLGWIIGLILAWGMAVRAERLHRYWEQRDTVVRVLVVLVISISIWLITLVINDRPVVEQPLAFISYLGFLSAILVFAPLEDSRIGFLANSESKQVILIRYVAVVGLVMTTMALLDWTFQFVALDTSIPGHALRFARYAVVASVAVLAAPAVFSRFASSEN